ncbi:TPA: hypothetical protein ACX6QL_002007 [Photobacterium damselae]
MSVDLNTRDPLVDSVSELTEQTTELLGQYRQIATAVNTQLTQVEGSINIAVEKSKEAEFFADKATKAASQAIQISGIRNVNQALSAKQGEYIGKALMDASGGRIKQIVDSNGNYNTMFAVPCFTFDDVGMGRVFGGGIHPAFLKENGQVITEIWVGVYTATNKGGCATVVAGADPYININIDEAKSKCAQMGAGWHLMTRFEWSAIALWCLANGFQPHGNTEFGRYHAKKWEVTKRYDGKIPNDRSGLARGCCGMGPDTWRHNNSPCGISDMVGNVNEFIDGIKMVDGQFIAATKNQQDEALWVPQAAYLDKDCKLTPLKTHEVSFLVEWKNIEKDSRYVSNTLLKQLLIEPVEQTKLLNGRFFFSNRGTRFPACGGAWYEGSDCGLAYINFLSNRSFCGTNFGFRPVFIAP